MPATYKSCPNKQLHPMACFSTALREDQKNWSATTKEAFALVLAVCHWNVYLAGSTFVLNSDHNTLSHLRRQPDPRGKIGQWGSELEEYDYTIYYIRGKENVKADALSRYTNASPDQQYSNFEEKAYASTIKISHPNSGGAAERFSDCKLYETTICRHQRVTWTFDTSSKAIADTRGIFNQIRSPSHSTIIEENTCG